MMNISRELSSNSEYLHFLQDQAVADGKHIVVGGLIVNDQNQVFVQKRAEDRALFPGCWDISGGHVDPGETLYQALAREIEEETGWKLVRLIKLVQIFDWQQEQEGLSIEMREFDFLVEVDGNLNNPRIEADKFSEFRWIGEDELAILKENRPSGDTAIHDIALKALAS